MATTVTSGSFGGGQATVTATTSVLTPVLDTSAAGLLAVGGTTATSLAVGSAVAANSAGTVQGNATAITGINNIITVSANNSGVSLPATAVVNQEMRVVNTHASNVLKIYPDGSGTINGASSVTLAGTKSTTYLCTTAGANAVWYSLS